MNLPFLQNNRLLWAFLLVLGLAVVGQAQTNPPQIITEPKSQSVAIGQEVTIDVEATGTEPLFYRWAFNGQYFGPPSKKSAFTIKKTDESSAGSDD